MPLVYIVCCADNSLYVGWTNDLVTRVQMHNEGRGGRYTANRSPVHVVYSESYDSSEAAISREQQLKRWTTKKKQALIAGPGRSEGTQQTTQEVRVSAAWSLLRDGIV